MDKIITKYRDSGVKMTPQRMAILQYLRGNKAHPSAEDIYTAILEKFPTMSFATVYNTLEMLSARGDLRELTLDGGRKRFDPDPSPHHHMICIHCRTIEDVFQDFAIRLPQARKSSFHVSGYHIEFYGTCAECRQTGKQAQPEGCTGNGEMR